MENRGRFLTKPQIINRGHMVDIQNLLTHGLYVPILRSFGLSVQ
jgi:hypothetical protein